MMAVQHRGLNLNALQSYLTESGLPLDGPLQAELISGGKSNLTYAVFDNSSRWVLRRPPTSGLTPKAHDVAREYRLTSALQGTGVPVARTVALCEDESVIGATFTLVEYVNGRVIRTKSELAELADQDVENCTRELVDVLGTLHNVDYQAAGLGSFGRPDGYVARQVQLWAKQWGRVKANDSADLDRLYATLADSVPARSEASIVHGDYRIDNTILAADDVRVEAVVDWELSALGDPLTDVALMCVYRSPVFDLVIGEPAAWTSSRLPSADDLAQWYTVTSGRELVNWNFYLALANFKLAVIAEGINYRYRAGATVGEGFDRAGESVPEFIAAGLRSLRADTF
jgi:aminoglycoside phosphotransferase (APT) family kinase protein